MEAQRLKASEKQWLNVRRAILQKIKHQVRLYLGPEPEDLQAYGEDYRRAVERPWCASSVSELLSKVAASSVVFGGDFHTFPQAQRAHLRLLRKIRQDPGCAGKTLGIALEAFSSKDQIFVDRYLASQISAEELTASVAWEENWGFAWSSYAPILEFARQFNIPVYGVDKKFSTSPAKALEERDAFAGREVAKILEAGDVDLVYVIFGDLHIADGHLPASFRKAWRKGAVPPTVSLFLNPERVYFELAEQKLEAHTEVVAYSPSSFALIASPPWVKWQNYLMFLEENHDYDFEDDDGDEDIEYTDHVLNLVRMLGAAMGIEVSENDIEVYSAGDHLAIEKASAVLQGDQRDIAEFLLASDRSFYLPSQGFFYLSKSSVNHASSLAAQYVHAKLCGRQQLLWNFPGDFVALIWVEAMGFFLSKFINPKRKSQSMADLKKQLRVFHPTDAGRDPLLLALDQKMAELLRIFDPQRSRKRFSPRKKSSYVEAARFLGPILGEKYFYFYQKNKFSRDQMLDRLSFDPSREDCAEFYFKELRTLDKLSEE